MFSCFIIRYICILKLFLAQSVPMTHISFANHFLLQTLFNSYSRGLRSSEYNESLHSAPIGSFKNIKILNILKTKKKHTIFSTHPVPVVSFPNFWLVFSGRSACLCLGPPKACNQNVKNAKFYLV